MSICFRFLFRINFERKFVHFVLVAMRKNIENVHIEKGYAASIWLCGTMARGANIQMYLSFPILLCGTVDSAFPDMI